MVVPPPFESGSDEFNFKVIEGDVVKKMLIADDGSFISGQQINGPEPINVELIYSKGSPVLP